MTLTTPPERYADLTDPAQPNDARLTRLIGALDRALGPQSAPPGVRAGLDRLLRERAGAARAETRDTEHAAPRPRGTLSRREALRAGAASFAFLLTLGHTTPALRAELARLAGEGPMTGARLAEILRDERARWNALLAQVGPARMEMPGVEGEWSVKQLVAHLTWYEEAVLDGARQFQASGKIVRRRGEESLDDRNARIAKESQARPLSDVLAEADQVFAHLLTLVAAIPDELLNDPSLAGLPEDSVPWMLVANNSYSHYRLHEQSVSDWLSRRQTDA